MPYRIQELPSGQFARVRTDTGKVVSRHATRAKAMGATIAALRAEGEDVSKAFK